MKNDFVRLLFEERKNLQNKIAAIDLLIEEYEDSSTSIVKENQYLQNVSNSITLETIITDKFPKCEDFNKWHKLVISKQIQQFLKEEHFQDISTQKISKYLRELGYIFKMKNNQYHFAILETDQNFSTEKKIKQADFFSENSLIGRILFAFDSLGNDITYLQVANFLLTTQEMDKKEGVTFSRRIGRIVAKMESEGLLRQTGLKRKALTYNKV